MDPQRRVDFPSGDLFILADPPAELHGGPVSAPEISSAGLDPRRRRILFRAHHRGMREMDILFGKFADTNIAGMSNQELDDFERLLENATDRDVFMWLTEEAPVWPEFDTGVFRRLKQHHTHTSRLDL